ncbi:MAG TPA: sigma-54 dependent transcriptional regulator [Chthoniobacterales bacterium]|jgi:DNA-binding NtrC family response regulator
MNNQVLGKILVIDDERPVLMTLEALLTRKGYSVLLANTAASGRNLVEREKPDVVLLDLGLPDGDGMELLKEMKTARPDLQVIILTGQDSLHNAIESIKLGAFHFISKPYAPEEVVSLLSRALEAHNMQEETAHLREEAKNLKKQLQRAEAYFTPQVRSRRMQEIYELVRRLASSDASVLILGESGVGKEVLANHIHKSSRRSEGPLVKLNCAAFPANMIESELFGYVKGAFTGAVADFPGMIQESAGGTLFLDELAEMPPELQTRLLRVLQEREYRPLGSTKTKPVDFRLIAATNRSIDEALESGRLREDLYYRLNTFQMELPPLRERREDIPSLVNLFLETFASQMGKQGLVLSAQAMEKISAFHWPGNVRQLRNAIEYAVVLAEGHAIEESHLPAEIRLPAGLQTRRKSTLSSVQSLIENEKQTIIKALAATQGNKKRAAEMLGIYRPTLYQKIRRLGIEC